MLRLLTITALLFLTTSTAAAQPSVTEAPPSYTTHAYSTPSAPPARELRDFSLTISPLHLLFPVLELTGEFRLSDKFGLAAIGGIGKTTDGDSSFGIYELGGQARWYAVGDFDHGMQLGAEVLYVHLTGEFDDGSITGTGSGLAVGPFVGYKISTQVGFTFDAQLGVQMMAIAAQATDGTTSESGEASDLIPLLNLNVGWAF